MARFAAKTGKVDQAVELCAELEAERSELRARPAHAPRLSNLDRLKRRIIEEALHLRSAFDAAPEEGRVALRTLLGDRRMRVAADPKYGFRVEGLFELPLSGNEWARTYRPGPEDEVVAGRGFFLSPPLLEAVLSFRTVAA